MPRFFVNDIHYYYTDQGRGPAVLLLHGFSGSAASWTDLAGRLAESYRVLAVDLLGHGRTDAPADARRYRLAAAAADLAALIQAVIAQPVHLLGYSMGGRLALIVARHYPHLLRSLVLESASPGLADAAARQARRAQDDALAERIEREGIEAFVDTWQALPLWRSQERLPAEVRARLRQQRLANRPLGLANSLRGMGAGVQPPLWNELAEIRSGVPVLLLAGEEDEKFVAINRQMATSLPWGRLVIIPQAGHTVHLEQPERFYTEVAGWIGRLDQAPGGGKRMGTSE